MTPATVDTLRAEDVASIAIFRGVDPAAVRKVLKDCPIRTVPAGTILMEPGKPNDTIHFLLSGPARGAARRSACRPTAAFRFFRARASANSP